MNIARLYETPEQFAEMMKGRLREVVGVHVGVKDGDPLLLDLWTNPANPEEKAHVSLHETYRVYRNTGDLNPAIDYLNGLIRSTLHIRSDGGKLMRIDPLYLYPAIRDEDYVLGQTQDMEIVSEPVLPGLRMIFLEIKDNVVKIVNQSMLDHNPRFTAEKVKRLALRNLRAEGWHEPRLSLTSPTRKSCTIDVYMEYPYPIDYQFFVEELAVSRMPESYAIAYTNRRSLLVMHSHEPMDTLERAQKLVRESRFKEAARRSCHTMPGPVSEQIYWVYRGKAVLLAR